MTISENCDRSRLLFQAGAAAFSAAGNWPFFGVAREFGNRYSKAAGMILGIAEFGSYWVFRMKNFEEIRQSMAGISGQWGQSWQQTALHVGIAALGLVSQFPLMVLVYYGNGENWAYPALSGICEASFTVLSLLLTLHAREPNAAEGLALVDQALQDLSTYPIENYEALVEVVQNRQIEGISRSDQGLVRSDMGKQMASMIGLMVALYLTTVNGTVSYQGVKAIDSRLESVAIAATVLVSAANIALLAKCCMDSAVNYYEGGRDLIRGRYASPIAKQIAPKSWWTARAAAATFAWLAFGTTATAAGYLPKVGSSFTAIAPLSAALLLNAQLNEVADACVLWTHRGKEEVKQFQSLRKALLEWKEELQNPAILPLLRA